MLVVRVASPKERVAKAVLAATLGFGLRRVGRRVPVLGRDRENAPRQPRGSAAGRDTGSLLNQIEPRHRLCRDVLALAHEMLGERLFGTVHHDEAVAEAATRQMTVLDHAPDGVAAHGMAAVANRDHGSLAPAA